MIDTLTLQLSASSIDWARLLLVYLHLLCCTFALALVLSADWQIARGTMSARSLRQTAHKASAMLGLLWCTGILLVIKDTGLDVTVLEQMSKLQLKLVVVMALTINGLLLHFVSFPLVVKRRNLTLFESLLISVTGAISTSHWLFAAFIGIARPIGEWPLESLLSAYVLLTMAAVVSGIVISPWIRRQLSGMSYYGQRRLVERPQ